MNFNQKKIHEIYLIFREIIQIKNKGKTKIESTFQCFCSKKSYKIFLLFKVKIPKIFQSIFQKGENVIIFCRRIKCYKTHKIKHRKKFNKNNENKTK